jgi:hypothetical protein
MENLDEERVKVLHTTASVVCASENNAKNKPAQEPEYA